MIKRNISEFWGLDLSLKSHHRHANTQWPWIIRLDETNRRIQSSLTNSATATWEIGRCSCFYRAYSCSSCHHEFYKWNLREKKDKKWINCDFNMLNWMQICESIILTSKHFFTIITNTYDFASKMSRSYIHTKIWV